MTQMDSPAGASPYLATDRQPDAPAAAPTGAPTGALTYLTDALASFYEGWPAARAQILRLMEGRWLGVVLSLAFLLGAVLGLVTAEWGVVAR